MSTDMKNIIKSEFYKIRKSKVTWVAGLCLLGLSLLDAGVVVYAKWKGGEWSELMEDVTGIGEYAAYATGTLQLILIALFVGGMISNEYTNRTVRQVVSRGVPKVKIALGQYIALSTVMTVMTIAAAALAGIVTGVTWGFGSVTLERFVLLLLGQIAVVWSYSAISMLIAHLARSGGLSIGLNLLLLIGGGSVVGILAYYFEKEWLTDYWIDNMTTSALDIYASVASQGKFIAILFGVAIVFAALGAACFQARDID